MCYIGQDQNLYGLLMSDIGKFLYHMRSSWIDVSRGRWISCLRSDSLEEISMPSNRCMDLNQLME